MPLTFQTSKILIFFQRCYRSKARNIKQRTLNIWLHIESEMHHVSVVHHVFLAFYF
jgi:hypothetical protein